MLDSQATFMQDDVDAMFDQDKTMHTDSTTVPDDAAFWNALASIENVDTPDDTVPTARVSLMSTKLCMEASQKQTKLSMYKFLQEWIHTFPKPFPTTHEKKICADWAGISAQKVNHFCNNYRKRFFTANVMSGKKVNLSYDKVQRYM